MHLGNGVGYLLDAVPEIDTSSVNAVLGGVVGLCILVIIALWVLVTKLANKNEKLQDLRLEDERKNTLRVEKLLKSQWAMQESMTEVIREDNHQQELLGARFEGLTTSFTNLSALLAGRGSTRSGQGGRGGGTDGGR